MQWTLGLFPQSRRDASDPTPSRSFEMRLQEIILLFDQAPDIQAISDADRLLSHLLQSISGQFALVGQPSSRQLTRFWFLAGEIAVALGDHRRAYDALECCAGLSAQNPPRDQIAIDYLRAEVAGACWLFTKSREGYDAITEHLARNNLRADDFVAGDLRTFHCHVALQRAQQQLALGDFAKAQSDIDAAAQALDHALSLCGVPRPAATDQADARALHPAFGGYAARLLWLSRRGEPTDDRVMRNWLELCLAVPALYVAITAWHTRLFACDRDAIDALASCYELLISCGDLSSLLPLWSAQTIPLYYRAAQVAIIGHDVAHLQRDAWEPAALHDSKRVWLQHADQALATIFGEPHQDDVVPSREIALRITLERHGLWLRQRLGYPDDFLGVPDLIEIGLGIKRLLQEAFAQGKTWGAARCTYLLGYVALASDDRDEAECFFHDALTLYEQAPGDMFYPYHEELRRALACLDICPPLFCP